MRIRRVTHVVVLTALIGPLLAGCGGPQRLTQREFFSRIVAAEAKAGSSQIAMTITSPGGQSIRSRGQMTIGTKAADTAMAMTTVGQQDSLGAVEVRLVDRAFYVRIGALTGKKYAKIDLTDAKNPIAQRYGGLIENLDPGRQLRQYQTAVTKFDNGGKTVKIDGVETVPYKFTIDPSKVPSVAGKTKTAAKSINYTMYVASDNLPRRMVSTGPDEVAGAMQLRNDYSHWGEPVVIKAPAASQIETGGLLSALSR